MSSASEALRKVRAALERKYKDSTELFPDFSTSKDIEVIPSPSAIINAITGIGGLPRGRVTEIYGPFSSGKTTIAIECAAACQQADPKAIVAYIDFEHAFDARYARNLGLDLASDRFIFSQPEYGEQGAAVVDALLDADLVDMIVFDSAAAMTPRSEVEGEIDNEGGTQKGTQAAMMAKILAIFTKKINKGRKPALVLINQTRARIVIGRPGGKTGPAEQSAAGNAIKFYTSLRLELDLMGSEGDTARGTKGTDQVYTQNKIRVTAIKNKLAPPFMRGTFTIQYGKGIDNIASIAELAEARLGIMAGAGFFKYNGDTPATTFSCRGREAFAEELKRNPELQAEIERKVLASIRAEHAAALGIGEIKKSGRAKEIEGNAPRALMLDATPASTPSATLPPMRLEGDAPDLPIVDAEEVD